MIKKVFHFILVLMLSVSIMPLFHAKAAETTNGVDSSEQEDNTEVAREEMLQSLRNQYSRLNKIETMLWLL